LLRSDPAVLLMAIIFQRTLAVLLDSARMCSRRTKRINGLSEILNQLESSNTHFWECQLFSLSSNTQPALCLCVLGAAYYDNPDYRELSER
jgi:hypothetical protein